MSIWVAFIDCAPTQIDEIRTLRNVRSQRQQTGVRIVRATFDEPSLRRDPAALRPEPRLAGRRWCLMLPKMPLRTAWSVVVAIAVCVRPTVAPARQVAPAGNT